mgnify:CR=1 FL=1
MEKEKQGYWVVIPTLLLEGNLTKAMLYGIVGSYALSTGICFASNATLAKKIGKKDTSIIRTYLSELEKEGWLTIENRESKKRVISLTRGKNHTLPEEKSTGQPAEISTQSSISREVSESKKIAEGKKPSAHKEFIDFFFRATKRSRSITPIITGQDGANLKRVLKLELLTPTELQQAAIFFLVSPQYRQFSPTISTFLSAGIITGIANVMRNRGTDFWIIVNDWGKELSVEAPPTEAHKILDTASRMDQMREQLKSKFAMKR